MIHSNYKYKQGIPDKWTLGNLSDLLVILNGKDHSKLKPGVHPVYGSGGIMRYVDSSLYSGESVLIPRKGTLNNIMYVNDKFWTVDTMYYTKILNPEAAIYTYFTVKLYNFEALNMGTGVPSMTASLIYSLNALIPPKHVIHEFNNRVKPLFDKLLQNNQEIKQLLALRNWLLPLLMNGQATLSLNASSDEQYPDEPLIVILTIFFMLIHFLFVRLSSGYMLHISISFLRGGNMDTKCPYCGGTDMIEGVQGGYGAVSEVNHGFRGEALHHIICRNCGTVIRSYVKDPEKMFPKKERKE